MAKHKKHRKHHYRGTTSLNLGDLGFLNYSVNSTNVALGGLAGVGGALGLKWAANKSGLTAKLPAFLVPYTPLLGSIITGAIAYFAASKLKKVGGREMGRALLTGSVVGGLAVQLNKMAIENFPSMADVTSLKLNGWNGFIVNDTSDRRRALNGFIVNDNSDRTGAFAEYADAPGLADVAMHAVHAQEMY